MADGPRLPLPTDRAVAGVLAATALALLARFVLLGDRVAHWDEARVAYWILDYAATGQYYYRPIVHGPFYHHVTRPAFALLGETDVAVRVVPALVGGLLPLSVLLLRGRLRDAEVVALAVLLAVDPALLYYSRFMRGDVPVGAFMFVAFALLVRGIDRRDRRHLFPAVAFVALGFAVKENALAYLAAWAGAAVLLLDHRLMLARTRADSWVTVLARELVRAAQALRSLTPVLALAAVEFVAVITWFYAPRGDLPDAGTFYRNCGADYTPLMRPDGVVGWGEALANPGALPEAVAFATVGSAEVFACQWMGPRATRDGGNAYLYFFGDLAFTVAFAAGALVALALVGFAVARYGSDRPRDLVQFATYWGVASLVGYPLIVDIPAPWAAVHIVLPLAVPAAVGAVYLLGVARGAPATRNRAGVAAAAALLLAGAHIGGVAVYGSYAAPQSPDNDLVQYAQPAGDLRPTLDEMARVAAERERPHVLVYGNHYVDDGGPEVPRQPGCVRWFAALPLPWYFAAADATVACAANASVFDRRFGNGTAPPVVIARADVESGRAVPPPELAERLDGYDARVYAMRASHDRNQSQPTVFFVQEGATAAGAEDDAG